MSRPNYSSDIRSEMSFRGTSRKTAKKNQKQFNKTGIDFQPDRLCLDISPLKYYFVEK